MIFYVAHKHQNNVYIYLSKVCNYSRVNSELLINNSLHELQHRIVNTTVLSLHFYLAPHRPVLIDLVHGANYTLVLVVGIIIVPGGVANVPNLHLGHTGIEQDLLHVEGAYGRD